MRSPRAGSSAKSRRRCRCPIVSWWAVRAFHAEDMSARLGEGGTLAGDHRHEVVPRAHERLRAFVLELRREGVDVDTGPGETGQQGRAAGAVSVTAASQRLTKTEATEPTLGLRPMATRRSMPRRYASAAAT